MIWSFGPTKNKEVKRTTPTAGMKTTQPGIKITAT